MNRIFLQAASLLILLPVSLQAGPVDFVRDVRPIFEEHCHSCHGAEKQKSGLRLDIKSEAFKGGIDHAPDIIPKASGRSPLIRLVKGDDKDHVMPPKGERLGVAEIATLTAWIDQGAVWPDGVDLAKLEDKRDHWSFKPLRAQEPGRTVDDFIDDKLAEQGLHRSPPADPLVWLRRVTLDLTGLPPTPEEAARFRARIGQNQKTDRPFLEVVERLLTSPRYGERWAQHWLDVVRYADTHGFEVNTPRPNAWPYRDYVIAAFNNDTPYDQFIREQLAGDRMNRDAATGFLVTSAVLLPGQIGKDDASKRLARQDELGEMVINTGEAFLGLSIGCARCHDHKFDPITSKDYYSLQAFFAGVEYGDRPLRSPGAETARQEAKRLTTRRDEIGIQIAKFVPLAGSGVKRAPVNAEQNTERFAPVKARRVRFTIRSTNNLEPCLDELEVFDASGKNVALASEGALPTASGSRVSANRHELRHINDGQYGNARSWMSNEVGKGWIMIEFPGKRPSSASAGDGIGRANSKTGCLLIMSSKWPAIPENGGSWLIQATDHRMIPRCKSPRRFPSPDSIPRRRIKPVNCWRKRNPSRPGSQLLAMRRWCMRESSKHLNRCICSTGAIPSSRKKKSVPPLWPLWVISPCRRMPLSPHDALPWPIGSHARRIP
ncbi:MAG: DUF1549 domain-containing protein [Verrucomicrobiales bacterium]